MPTNPFVGPVVAAGRICSCVLPNGTSCPTVPACLSFAAIVGASAATCTRDSSFFSRRFARPRDRQPPPRSPARRRRPPRRRSPPWCAGSILFPILFPQHVAEPADGLDQPRLAHLPPQIADVDPQPVRFRTEIVPPHRFEYLRPGKHPARVADEQFEQREFGLGQRQPFTASTCLVCRVTAFDLRAPEQVGACAAAPQQRAQPR